MKILIRCFISAIALLLLLFSCNTVDEAMPSSNWPSESVSSYVSVVEENPPVDLPSESALSHLSAEQIYNMIEDDENWFYFDDGIVKQCKKDNKRTLLRKEKEIGDTSLVDDWLYFVLPKTENHFDICRVKTDGSDFTTLVNDSQFVEYKDEYFHEFIVIGNSIYIQMSFGFYEYNMEADETLKISDDIGSHQIVGNSLYYIDHAYRTFTIYKMDLTSKEIEIVLGDGEYDPDKLNAKNIYKNFIFIGDAMFYYVRSPDGLYRFQNDETRLISDNANVDEFSLLEYEGKLYFVIRNNNGVDTLMKYNPKDETLLEVLTCNDYSRKPKIIDGCFFYMDSERELKQIKI